MDYIVGFALLLGVLIFIHELGHFLVAKACGMRVETFSIGMGKKIISLKRGETEYTLSILPLGGYVKITGQDPREEVPPELADRAYRTKPIWQRAAVVLAGPIFNAVLAVVVMTTLFMVGMQVGSPVLGRVLPESPAFVAGFRSGDIVSSVAIDGQSTRIRERADLENAVGDSVGKNLIFSVERKKTDSTEVESLNIAYTPVLGHERDSTIGVVRERGVIEGAEPQALAPIVYVTPGSWAAARGLPSPFYVDEIQVGTNESVKLNTLIDLENVWMKGIVLGGGKTADGRIVLKGRKVLYGKEAEEAQKKAGPNPPEPTMETFTLAWNKASDGAPDRLLDAGLRPAELSLIEVVKDSPADKLGLKEGDLLLTLNDKAIQSFNSFREEIQTLAAKGETLRLGWLRDGKGMSSDIKPEVASVRDPLTEAKKNQFQIGGLFLALQAPSDMNLLKAEGFGDALNLGFHKSVGLTTSMLVSFYHLAKGDISPKTLGGPLLIGKIAGESFRQGWVPFFRMMAFISLNLFLLNLFPIPVLDGGHLVLLGVGAIRRRPLSIKVIEAWTTAGFFLLMGLVAVVFFNDLSRLGLFRFFKS